MNMVGVIYNGQTYNGAETREKEKKEFYLFHFVLQKRLCWEIRLLNCFVTKKKLTLRYRRIRRYMMLMTTTGMRNWKNTENTVYL